ncbi:class I SAM-dependent methyltransferase [Candidatus Pelagibacter sp.]|nr:class I SAM-dependent methyltransferase [Candidatus Pelagibacter sp.]
MKKLPKVFLNGLQVFYSKDDIKREPATYQDLAIALDISNNEFHKQIKKNIMNSHSQVKDASLFARRLEVFINKFSNTKDKTVVLDCGCGLGFIGRALNNSKNFKVFFSEPSRSIKKIINAIYPDKNFLHLPIEEIPEEFNNFFDVIYLREVYPFTRSNDINMHVELIRILKKKLKENGILIFEQIKNKEDIFDNLKKLKLDYKKFYLFPVKLFNYKWFLKIYFRFNFLPLISKLFYKLAAKKISHYIIVKK